MTRTGVIAVIAVIAVAQPASAHPLDIGYLRLEASRGAVSVALDLDLNAAARVIEVEPHAIDAATVAAQATRLAGATIYRAPMTTELGDCRWAEPSATVAGRTTSIAGRADCPAGARTIRWTLPFVAEARVSAVFQLLVKARLPGGELVTTLDRNKAELALELGGATSVGFTEFVWSGVEHIGAAPSQWHDGDGWKLPDGLDHILFLIALMLAGGSLLHLVGIASGFTLGHSITLALSALGVVRPPAAVIEPLIALSIALVAGATLLGRSGTHRWKVAACFGLLHGFGFASALNELDLSMRDTVTALFGYNVGVELGQLAIVLVTAPLILMVQRHRRAHHIFVRGLAAAIFLAGMYWFLRRLLG